MGRGERRAAIPRATSLLMISITNNIRLDGRPGLQIPHIFFDRTFKEGEYDDSLLHLRPAVIFPKTSEPHGNNHT